MLVPRLRWWNGIGTDNLWIERGRVWNEDYDRLHSYNMRGGRRRGHFTMEDVHVVNYGHQSVQYLEEERSEEILLHQNNLKGKVLEVA